ncbi:hypothetical protein WJX72_012190 [[Myrmecia] bisecta]|uniref:Uncharacterized protein n=1 Tax=[Myrmecia] bisecta TaxID=41462 RepID=A0AAW1R9L5_9CHLO
MPDTGTPLLTAADLAVLAAANLPSDVKARVLQAAAQPVPLTPADLRAIADANLPLDVMARIMTWAALSMAVASGAATCSSAAQAADHQQGDAAAEDGASHALCAADQASSEGVVKERVNLLTQRLPRDQHIRCMRSGTQARRQ